jgi:hypothetical protein
MFDHSNQSDSPRVKRQKSSSYPGRFKTSTTVMLYPWIMLGIEANRVVGLRVMKLMLGGKSARREARMMVTEKIRAGSGGECAPNGRCFSGRGNSHLSAARRRECQTFV